MKNCQNCNVAIEYKFCPHCGNASTLKRVDQHYISHEIQHLLHFEKGLFFTIKELFVRPGLTVKTFLTEDRTKHMKPIAYLAVTTLLFGLLSKYINPTPKEPSQNWPFSNPAVMAIENYWATHANYAYLFKSFFIAVWLKLFFKKFGYNFYEVITLMCFLAGQFFILSMLLIPFYNIFNNYVFLAFVLIIGWVYPAFGIGQFFDKNNTFSYVKGFIAMILGYITASVVTIAVGLGVYHLSALVS